MNILQRALSAITKPKTSPALSGGQTDATDERAQVGWLRREFAEHPSKGLTPAKLYSILAEAEAGSLKRQHELFMDMEEKDAQIASDLGKRKLALCNLEWQIVPPEGASRIEKKAAAQAQAVFSALEVDDIILDLSDGIGHGWVNLELPWSRDGEQRIVLQPIWRPHSWFMIDPNTDQNELRLRDGSVIGEELWPLGWMRHVHKAKSGYITRLGLHRTLVWPYLFKNYAVGDLAELLDILGIPARLGKYPYSATEVEKTALLNAVMSLGRKAAGIIPEGMEIEYLEAAKDAGQAYTIMLDWCERSISKAILGGTLTTGTDAGSGAYALGEVHERGLAAIVGADARQIASTITRDLLFPMAALNFGITAPSRAPRFYLDTESTEDLDLLAKSLPVFVDMGAKIPCWWLHEKTGIPEAQASEPILEKSQTQVVPVLPEARGGDGADSAVVGEKIPENEKTDATKQPETGLVAKLAANRDAPDWAERNAEVLERLADPMIRAMIGSIKREMNRAGSLPELQARLLELYPELDAKTLPDLLGRAFVTAHLVGRDEADRSAYRG